MKWTPEQQRVIDARNRNLLVSAAAGSGKTAVLVERILGLVLDPEHPVDIDRLLVVTFTNAAAQEMKNRLYQALSERERTDPENRHLRRQLQLVFQAQVCTIDSFCLSVLRNYPEEAGIDPGFRIMDPGEEKLLQSDVMEELFEEEYEACHEDFLKLLEGFSSAKSDEALSSLVLSVYRFSRSHPWPDRWLQECIDRCDIRTPEELFASDWCSWYLHQVKLRLQALIDQTEKLVRMSTTPLVPESFARTYRIDAEKLREAGNFSDYREARAKIFAIKLERQPVGSKKGYDETLQTRIKEKRGLIKKRLERFQEGFALSEQEILSEICVTSGTISTLVRLVRRYAELYAAAKAAKGIADFSDIEHIALSILYKDGERSAAARELSGRFHEIMIDEYQDSNRVQEEILTAVSRASDGENNIFMVGDMKQSIYRFRMADPSLFTEKYKSYSRENGPKQLIELSRNFRSRKEITRTANWFFFQLMQEAVGGIEYSLHTALYPGADFPEVKISGKDPYRSEILLAGMQDAPEDCSKQEAEALLIADKIHELVSEKFPVAKRDVDGTVTTRPAEYKDIVILLRTAAGWDTVFQQVLEEQGIPVYVESRSGYFDAPEVRLVLNILSVIDNPMNDIPLAAVLNSRFFGFTAEDLARIHTSGQGKRPGNGLYGELLSYEGDEALMERIRAFFTAIAGWRRASSKLSLSMLLRQIYRETGILSYVLALPSGRRREANLRALLTKAANFENTSYHGIFHFIRYVDKLRKYEADEGEQNTSGENDNVVRLMTIHKSKGLEFPIVFLSGASKPFNTQDSKNRIILHQDYGIAADIADPERRIRKKSFMREVFSEKNRVETLGEELRVLYVGMTRAKEKLFVTGTIPDEEKFDALTGEIDEVPERLSYGELTGADCVLSWLLPAVRTSGPMDIRLVAGTEISGRIKERQAVRELDYTLLQSLVESAAKKENAFRKSYDERFSFRYDSVLSRVYSSISVSALKAAGQREEEERMEAFLFDDRPEEERKEGITGISGRERGTLYHRVMEKIDPHRAVKAQLDEWEESGVLSHEERRLLYPPKIEAFFTSDLGKRFIQALDKSRGFRERQFIIGIPAETVYPELSCRPEGKEQMMLQGIVDLYFEEEDGLVVVDYKTDRVDAEEVLASRYRVQLEWYERALEQATGKKVKEKWIWSFALGKEIRI